MDTPSTPAKRQRIEYKQEFMARFERVIVEATRKSPFASTPAHRPMHDTRLRRPPSIEQLDPAVVASLEKYGGEISGKYWLHEHTLDLASGGTWKDSLTIVPNEGKTVTIQGGITVSQAGKPLIMYSRDTSRPGFFGVPLFWGMALVGLGDPFVKDLRTRGAPLSRNENETYTLKPGINLYPDQAICVHHAMKQIQETGGTVMVQDPGLGKTMQVMKLILLLGRRALFITPASLAKKQAIPAFHDKLRIRDKVTGELRPPRVYRWQGSASAPWKTKKGREADIIIASATTVGQATFIDPAFRASIGTVIVDELHFAASQKQSMNTSKFPAAVRIGLTASPDRKDGTARVLFYNTGELSVSLTRMELAQFEEMLFRIVEVHGHAIKTSVTTSNQAAFRRLTNAERCLRLVESPFRLADVLMAIVEALYVRKLKRVFVFTQRKIHVAALQEAVQRLLKVHVPAVDGSLTQKQATAVLDHAQQTMAPVTVAMEQCCGTGFDDPSIDALVLALPASNAIQVIGRAERTFTGKTASHIYMFKDKLPVRTKAYYDQIHYMKSRWRYMHAPKAPRTAIIPQPKLRERCFQVAHAAMKYLGPYYNKGKPIRALPPAADRLKALLSTSSSRQV